ncbi:phospholipase-like protein [Tanacetum coccineum]
MEMVNPPEIFDAKVSLRSKMHLMSTIKGKLQPYKNCEIMFRNTVFGRWLDITSNPNDNHLINYVLQHQVYVPQPSIDCPLMVFKIGGHELKFGRNEFCLVTGTLNVAPKHVEMHLKLKNQAGKKMATYNINDMDFGTYPNCIQWWTKQSDIVPRALAWSKFKKFDKTEYQLLFGPDSIPILELTPTDKELKETWLIGSLSYIRGEDVPFIQSVKPVENVDKAVTIDDHISTCPTDSNTLLEDVDSLFKEVIDVRPDLVGRVGELRTKIVQTLASIVSNKETVVANIATRFIATLSQGNGTGYVYSAMYLALNQINWIATFGDALKIMLKQNRMRTLKNDMSIGFEEDHLNEEIKVTLYQDDHIPLDETMDVAVKDTPVVTDSSPVVETIIIDSTFKVYFPLNELNTHWALVELHLRTDKIGVLKRKGLVVGDYKITYKFDEKVPHQGSVYGDCGVWVCLLLYRLTHKLPLVFCDPLQLENGTCSQNYALRIRRGGSSVRGNTVRKTYGSESVTNESSSNISNRLRSINGKVVRMKGKGDGLRACMYPGGRKPIGFGVSWNQLMVKLC